MTLREFGGRVSPMDRILRTRTYGLKIRMATKASGTVAWEGQNVLLNRIRFSMDDIRTVVHGSYETVNARLRKELLFVTETHPLPDFDIKKLAHNAAELHRADRRKIETEDQARIRLSQSPTFNGKKRHMAEGLLGWNSWQPTASERHTRTLLVSAKPYTGGETPAVSPDEDVDDGRTVSGITEVLSSLSLRAI